MNPSLPYNTALQVHAVNTLRALHGFNSNDVIPVQLCRPMYIIKVIGQKLICSKFLIKYGLKQKANSCSTCKSAHQLKATFYCHL